MNTQEKIIKILQKELVETQARNASYSLRAYAKRLRTSPSVISEILNLHRPVTKKNGEKFLNALNFSPEEIKKITFDLPNRSTSVVVEKNSFVQIDMNEFNLISNWYYFAILSLAETRKFKSDPAWIAERLGIKVPDAKKAIQTLVALELLELTKTHKLRATGKQFSTTVDISQASIRKSHTQHLELARQSLENDSVEMRDFSSITFTFDPTKMDLAKKLIREFRRDFCKKMEQTQKMEVHRLGIQLFPLTKITKKGTTK